MSVCLPWVACRVWPIRTGDARCKRGGWSPRRPRRGLDLDPRDRHAHGVAGLRGVADQAHAASAAPAPTRTALAGGASRRSTGSWSLQFLRQAATYQ